MKIDTAHAEALVDTLRTFREFVINVLAIERNLVDDIDAGASIEDIDNAVEGALLAIRDVIKTAANILL